MKRRDFIAGTAAVAATAVTTSYSPAIAATLKPAAPAFSLEAYKQNLFEIGERLFPEDNVRFLLEMFKKMNGRIIDEYPEIFVNAGMTAPVEERDNKVLVAQSVMTPLSFQTNFLHYRGSSFHVTPDTYFLSGYIGYMLAEDVIEFYKSMDLSNVVIYMPAVPVRTVDFTTLEPRISIATRFAKKDATEDNDIQNIINHDIIKSTFPNV